MGRIAFHFPPLDCTVAAEIEGRRVRRLRLKPGVWAAPPRTQEERDLARSLEDSLKGRRARPWRAAGALTPFQERVLRHVSRIPPGETRTYGEVARALRTSPRAVGRALGANPTPLLIPCHRIVASNGLGGFTGAGVSMKKRLLEIERETRQTL